MNYIGSKYSLLSEIQQILSEGRVPTDGIAADLFAGTGSVAQLLKMRGHIVYANDWQRYSYHTNVALVELDEVPSFSGLLRDANWRNATSIAPSRGIPCYSLTSREGLFCDGPAKRVLDYLDALPGSEGVFYDAYCEGGSAGRLYFSCPNGRRIQAIRDTIAHWAAAGLVSNREESWLIAGLIEAADRVANTASVYGAHLKHVKRSALRPLQMVALIPAVGIALSGEHKVTCSDSEVFLEGLEGETTLVYIDPPYNARQYCSNYHILETIARWDLHSFTPRGRTGLRPVGWQRSQYCSVRTVESAFRRLFSLLRSDYVLFSYNNEGLLSKEELEAIFHDHCESVLFGEVGFRRFRADIDREGRVYRGDETREFLVLGQVRRGLGGKIGGGTEGVEPVAVRSIAMKRPHGRSTRKLWGAPLPKD